VYPVYCRLLNPTTPPFLQPPMYKLPMRVHLTISNRPLQILVRKPHPGLIAPLKHHQARLERNASPDINPHVRTALQPPKARRRAQRRRPIVDKLARDGKLLAAHAKREPRQVRAAGKHVPAVGARVGRARNGLIVGGHDGGGQVQQRGAGIGDADDVSGVPGLGADREAGRGPAPVAGVAVDGDVREVSGVFGGVDEPEVVGAFWEGVSACLPI